MSCPFCALGFAEGPYPERVQVDSVFRSKTPKVHPDKVNVALRLPGVGAGSSKEMHYLQETKDYANALIEHRMPVIGCERHFPAETQVPQTPTRVVLCAASTDNGLASSTPSPSSTAWLFTGIVPGSSSSSNEMRPMPKRPPVPWPQTLPPSSSATGAAPPFPRPYGSPASSSEAVGCYPGIWTETFKCTWCPTIQVFTGFGSGPVDQARGAGWSKSNSKSWRRSAKCPVCNGGT